MTIQVNFNPEMEARLIEAARSQGITVQNLIERLLAEGLASSSTQGSPVVDEFCQMLARVAKVSGSSR
jgi:hypothetical protein